MSKTPILGKSIATAKQMAAYLLSQNPSPKIIMDTTAYCRLYLYMGALEGVRGDIAFCQNLWETANLNYGGTVTPDQNNYAGLGTTSSTVKGAYFPDEATGILAQIQHDKSYATQMDLNYDNVDPRRTEWFMREKGGTAAHWEELGGTWAVPGYDTKKYASLLEANNAHDSYGYKIMNLYNEMMSMFDAEGNRITSEDIQEEAKEKDAKPLVGKRICIDAGHYGSRYNKCPAIPEYAESEMAWKLHLMQKKYLEQLGAEVILTREEQAVDRALNTRGRASVGCDLFISDHSNAVGNGMNEAVDYVAVYHLVDDVSTQCDDISKELAQMLAPVIAEVMGTKQGYKVLTRKSGEDKNGDGTMNDNYYGVLNGARSVGTPGLILEHSFHTNTEAVKWLLVEENLDRLAKAEAECIAAYFSGKEVVANKPVEATAWKRVQTGAFKNYQNAVIEKDKLIAAGFNAIIVTVDGWHKVQSGAFKVEKNAEELKNRLVAAGFKAIIV